MKVEGKVEGAFVSDLLIFLLMISSRDDAAFGRGHGCLVLFEVCGVRTLAGHGEGFHVNSNLLLWAFPFSNTKWLADLLERVAV